MDGSTWIRSSSASVGRKVKFFLAMMVVLVGLLGFVLQAYAANSSIQEVTAWSNSILDRNNSADGDRATYTTFVYNDLIQYRLAKDIPSGNTIDIYLDIESQNGSNTLSVRIKDKNDMLGILATQSVTVSGRETAKKITFNSVNQDVRFVEITRTGSTSAGLILYEVDVPKAEVPATTPPAAPSSLTATAGNTKVDLAWTQVSGATGYTVKRSTTAGGPYTAVSGTVSAATYTDTNVVNGTKYYYIVTATNSIGESANSVEASATPTASGNPSDPGSSSGQASLLIHLISGLTKTYELTKAEINSFIAWYDEFKTGSGRDYYTFTRPAVTGDTRTYKDYIVLDKIEEFEVGEDVSAPQISAPSSLSAAGSLSKISLNWSAVSGATGYNVKRATTQEGPFTTVAAGVAGTSYEDTAVANGVTYYYVVTALASGAESGNSVVASAALSTLPVPSGLTATGGLSKISLNWSAVSGATGYNVKRAATQAGPFSTVAAGISGTSYEDTAVTSGVTYYYVVTALASGIESGNSVVASASPATLPSPSNLTATGGISKINLNWGAVSGASAYNVKRATAQAGPFSVVASGINGTSYEDTSVTNGVTYYYVVTAMAGGTESSNSTVASATPVAPLVVPGTVQNLAASSPSTSPVTLTWTAPTAGNVAGQSIYDIRYSEAMITESNWSTATQVTGEPQVAAVGTAQTMNISSLTPNKPYYFAMKTVDAAGNASVLSNVVTSSIFYSEELNFDGDDVITIGDLGARPEKGTIEFWMNSSAVENYRNPFSTNGGNVGIRFEQADFGAGLSSFGVVMGNNTGTFSSHTYRPLTNPLLPNTWYHIALVWDSSQNKVWGYLNGVEVFGGEAQNYWSSNFTDVKLGNGASTAAAERYFKGKLRDFRMWNTARTAAQIQGAMNGVNSNESGLVVRR